MKNSAAKQVGLSHLLDCKAVVALSSNPDGHTPTRRACLSSTHSDFALNLSIFDCRNFLAAAFSSGGRAEDVEGGNDPFAA